MMTRRDALMTMGSGFGMTGLAGLLGASSGPQGPHFTPKAKRVIFLFLNGGPSHVDTFDPKPMLDKYDGKPMPGPDQAVVGGGIKLRLGTAMKSPFAFRKYGQSGIEVSDLFPKLGECIDDVCVIRSMYTDIPNHPPGCS